MVDRLVNSSLNAQRINNVENCFGSSGQPLSVPGRVLVGEGVLTKMCRKKPKPRQFFLFNDILVYGNILINKKKYNKQHIIPLEEVKLENLEDDSVMTNGWLIRTPTKSFAVYAATATEKSEWMAHISKCLSDLLQKTGKKQSTEHAAVWVPDGDATKCMHCRKTQFNIINRRHHCRKCGAVVCGMCSSKKFLLPSQSSKPLRVCLSCYDTLSKSRTSFSGESERVSTQETVEATENDDTNKPLHDDTSDDSDDEDDDEDDVPAKTKDTGDACHDLETLTIDDKPTFYHDNVDVSTAGTGISTREHGDHQEIMHHHVDTNHAETTDVHVHETSVTSPSYTEDTSGTCSADTGTADTGSSCNDGGSAD